jgi:hypothetical protein
MKKKGSLIGLVLIVLALTFIGPGDVGATNCYYLYYTTDDFIDCSDDMDFSSSASWKMIRLALHRDKNWEAAFIYDLYGFDARGTWDIFGNAIGLATNSTTQYEPLEIFKNSFPLFAGTKTGSAKLLPDPYKSKANIAKAQGYFSWTNDSADTIFSCWALKKVKNDQCSWIQE